MSCQSNDGNKVVINLAKHVANNANPETEPPSLSLIQHFFHTLTREGRSLGILPPKKKEVISWIQEQEGKILDSVPQSYAQQKNALENLASTKSEVTKRNFLPDGPTFHAWKHVASLAHYRVSQKDNPDAKVIAIDLDGCLYDYNYMMKEWLIHRGWDKNKLPDPKVYSLQEAWGIDRPTLYAEMVLAANAGQLWNDGPFLADGLAGARTIGLAGHVLSVVSARAVPGVEEIAARGTTTWLRENGLHVDKMHIVSPADPAAKLGTHFDLLIDDHPGNIEIALKHGRKAILLDREWNQDSSLPRASYDDIVTNLDFYIKGEY